MIGLSSLLILHLAAGAAGLLSASVALGAQKGASAHRVAAGAFFLAMLAMAASGAYLAAMASTRPFIAAWALVAYLAATSWASIALPQGRAFETIAFCLALGLSVTSLFMASLAAAGPGGHLDGFPPAHLAVIGGIAGVAALLDLIALIRGGATGAQLIARHIWRMCLSLAIAAAIIWFGQ